MIRFAKFFCIYSLVVFFVHIENVLCTIERKLSQELNPGCNLTCGELIVIKAEGPNDILYYIWDFGHKPTFMLAEVPANTELNIDWSNFRNYHDKSINFSTPPSYIFGVVINKIYEFNDVEDSGVLPSDTNAIVAMGTEHFNWTIQNLLDNTPNHCVSYSIAANGYNNGNITKQGVIKIISHAYGSIGHAEDLPRLLHTENSSQIDLIIDHFTASFPKSRFAVEFVTLSSNQLNSKLKLIPKKTLDDENTPGVFVLDTLLVEDADDKNNERSGFLQWRPIVYTSIDKVVVNSTKTSQYFPVNVSDSVATLNSSLLYAFYGTDLSKFLVKAENISFGSTSDGFYTRTNFSSWSFLVGVGKPPEQPFSMLVFMIIAIGLGLPTLIIIGGTAFMIYRKVKSGE